MLRVSQELADLGRASETLQELVAEKVRASALSGASLLNAQDADLLAQRLAELAKFLRIYAEGIISEAVDPMALALDSVLLGALCRRLAPGPINDEPKQAAGELEMF
ncbi:MAG: hypothetical protein HY054_16065 [Proteobacteria bacterium]|nr:hypothetical protein [Pseudomonadota bacterium]